MAVPAAAPLSHLLSAREFYSQQSSTILYNHLQPAIITASKTRDTNAVRQLAP